MGTITYHNGFGTPGTATTIAPGTPISGGAGDFTTLSASVSFISTANFGSQCRLGKTGQAGRIEIARGNDGGFTAGLGFSSATEAGIVEVFNSGGNGRLSIKLNRSVSGFSEAARFSSVNDGSLSIGNLDPTARLLLPPGAAAAGRAPLKLTAGTNLTVVENGAFEFDGSNLFFTHTGIRRTITMA